MWVIEIWRNVEFDQSFCLDNFRLSNLRYVSISTWCQADLLPETRHNGAKSFQNEHNNFSWYQSMNLFNISRNARDIPRARFSFSSWCINMFAGSEPPKYLVITKYLFNQILFPFFFNSSKPVLTENFLLIDQQGIYFLSKK